MTPPALDPARPASPFSIPRDFLENRFVYVTVSPRARGLSVGVNFNPDKRCNFDCVYCEVDRRLPSGDETLDIPVMAAELDSTLRLIQGGGLQEFPRFAALPASLLQLKHVCLSGDGEPTLCPNFLEAVHAVLHLRALSRTPFKTVLVTNSSSLDRDEVQEGIRLFTRQDEIWAKLDAGSPEFLRRVNRTDVPLETILANLLLTAKKRPVIVQTLFAAMDGEEPALRDIDDYASRLAELAAAGAQIPLVQIYSATRPVCGYSCGHLPLRRLSQIAQTIRNRTGLKVEIF